MNKSNLKEEILENDDAKFMNIEEEIEDDTLLDEEYERDYDDYDDYYADEEDLIEEEIDEVTIDKRKKKGITNFIKKIFSKKENKEKEIETKEVPKLFAPFVFAGKKIAAMTKKIGKNIINQVEKKKEKFAKKEENLISEEIPKKKKRRRGLFSKKYDEIIEDELFENEKFTNLSLTKKIEKFLEGTNVTQEELTQIYNKINFIINHKKGNEQQEDINKFLDENIKDTSSEDRLCKLKSFIDKKCLLVSNLKVNTIKDIIDVYSLGDNKDVINLFNNIVNLDDYEKIERLYNFALNSDNFKENIIEEMYQILGKKEEIIDMDLVTEEKSIKPQLQEQTEPLKKVNSLENYYNKYKETLKVYEDKSSELELLKSEYKILKEAIFGKDLEFISRKQPTVKQLQNIKNRIEKVRVLVSDDNWDRLSKMDLRIKELQKEVDILSIRIKVYVKKDIEGQYNRARSIEYFDMIWNKECEDIRKDRTNQSVEVFNQFTDEEIAAISKYQAYERTLKL